MGEIPLAWQVGNRLAWESDVAVSARKGGFSCSPARHRGHAGLRTCRRSPHRERDG